MSMAGMVGVSLIVWFQHITLKLFWRTLGREWRHTLAAISHLSQSILKKLFNFSLLKEAFSICTNFHNDWLKTWPDIRNLVFLLNEEIYRKFAAICRHIFLDLQSVTKYLRLTLVFIWGSALLAGKLSFLLFKRFLLGLTKFSFCQGYCALGFHLCERKIW